MNRAERRRLAKQGVTHQDIISIERDTTTKVIDYATEAYSAAVVLTLHDKLGFGKVRSQRFIKQVWEIFSDIEKGYLSLDDVLDTVKTELEIDLKEFKGEAK